MTADDPRPAGEARNPFGGIGPECGRSFRSGSGRYYDCGRAYGHTGGHSAFPDRPAASGGATDGEREAYGPCRFCDWTMRGCNALPGVEMCCDDCSHPAAPVASQAEEGLREGLREELLAEFRMRFSPRIGMSERAVERLADAVVGLPAMRRLLADAAKVQRVEKLARQYKRFGEELHDVPRAESFADVALDLRRALGDQP